MPLLLNFPKIPSMSNFCPQTQKLVKFLFKTASLIFQNNFILKTSRMQVLQLIRFSPYFQFKHFRHRISSRNFHTIMQSYHNHQNNYKIIISISDLWSRNHYSDQALIRDITTLPPLRIFVPKNLTRRVVQFLIILTIS